MAERSDAHKQALNERTDQAMERYGFLSEEFEKSRDNDQEKTRTESREGAGSEMVNKDAPHPQPRPPSEISRPVDRDSFNNRWQEENKRADDRDQGEDRER